MTSNIWGDYFGNPVTVREDELYTVYCKYSPDVLGLQETTLAWYESKLMKNLAHDYTEVNTNDEALKWFEENGDPSRQNYVTLFYKTERFDLLEKGWFHYANTEDPSKCVTWAVLKDKATGGVFGACATHYEWRHGHEYDLARVGNSKEMLACMNDIKKKYNCPVFAFGDLNCYITSDAYKYLIENGCVNMQKSAVKTSNICTHHGDPVRGDDGKYRGTTTDKGIEYSLDHIVSVGDVDINEYYVVCDREALDATDHSPVYTDVEF